MPVPEAKEHVAPCIDIYRFRVNEGNLQPQFET